MKFCSNRITMILCILLLEFGIIITSIYSEEANNVKRPEIYAPFISQSLTVDGDATDWRAIKALGEGVIFFQLKEFDVGFFRAGPVGALVKYQVVFYIATAKF